jgi:hypothetical protein
MLTPSIGLCLNSFGVPLTMPSALAPLSPPMGAPFGGTTRGGHQGFDSEAFSLITRPNFGSGGGS